MKSPFKFLDAFELADKDVFFGRDKEVEALYRMVYQSNLILVYGYSGTGKTSLIQCGLAGRFDGPQWYPFYIRKGEDINRSTRKALSEAIDEAAPDDVSLTELVEAILDEYLSPVYLIFDQFEELFILGTPAEQAQFTRDIQELLSEDLSCKVIFTIREEYLGELYQLEQALPRLFDFKLRVETMNKRKVQEVLRSSFTAFNIGLEAPAEDRLEEIIANVSLKKAGIQLPYLQVYLDQLYREDYARTYPEGETSTASAGTDTPWAPLKFTQAEIGAFGTMAEVFPRFLEGQKEKIQQELAQKYPAAGIDEDTLRDVLDAFVTEEGTKRPVPFQLENELLVIPPKVLAKFPVENPLLTEAVQALEDSRILRVRDGSYELAHDSLAALIDAQRTDEQRQLNEVKVRLAGNYLEWQRTGEYLTRKQLISVEAFLDRLALEPHLEEFVAKSYAHNEAREAAEREKQQAELDKERKLRGEAETNARRAKLRTRIAGVLALLAVGALFFAVQQFGEAKDQATLAKEAAETAQEEKLKADTARLEAEQKRLAAEASDSIAQLKTREALQSDSLARINEQRALQNLRELETASAQIVNFLIDDATSLIYEANHQEALEKLRAAVPLRKRTSDVAIGLMELAYFYNEAGQTDLALGITDTVLRLLPSELAQPLLTQAKRSRTPRELINQSLQEVDRVWYDSLVKRYYPEMIDVQGGTFCFGALFTAEACDSSQLHTLSDFRIARTETTVWQYALFAEATSPNIQNPSWGWAGDNPVVNVSWYDAIAYGNWLSEQQGLDRVYQLENIPSDPNELANLVIDWSKVPDWKANGFRLPTEAEWEYAARSGIQQDTFQYSGSDDLDAVGWSRSNSDETFGANRTHPVGGKQANGLGLYDLSGNVLEWCWEADNSSVLRGGSWYSVYYSGRVLYRFNDAPNYRINLIGFRFAQGLPFGL